MSPHRYDEHERGVLLAALPFQARLAFAAAAAQRLLPALDAFGVRHEQQETVRFFRDVLDRIWQDLEDEPIEDAKLPDLIRMAEERVPDEADEGACYAENAAAAIVYALRCRLGGGSQEAIWAARQPYEAVYSYLGRRTDFPYHAKGYDQAILGHPLMQAELSRQAEDLLEVATSPIRIRELRGRASGDALTFLALVS